MARPAALNLNRAVGVTSDRQTAAPGLAVQAPLDVSVGPNNLQALADILGTGANIAISRAAQDSEQRVQEETDLLQNRAEADFRGGAFDEEQYRRSRTYRKTHDTLAGARQGVEGRLAMRQAATDFVTANPYADEAALREQLEVARMELLFGEDGQYKPEFQNERVRNIAESALMEEGYEYIARWRDPYTKRMQTKGMAEAGGLLVANGLAEGTTTVANMNATADQMKALGIPPETYNGSIATSVIALARELRKPELIDQLPLAWGDGSVGPRADAGLLATMDQQKTIIENIVESETREGQKWERFEFSTLVQEKIGRGELLTEAETAKAIDDLGYAPESVAGWNEQARRTSERIAAELAAAEVDAKADDVAFEDYQSNPYEVTPTKAEEILATQYSRASAAGDSRAVAEILRIGSQNGHLPANLRRELNNAPVNFDQFGRWHQMLKGIDQMDDELYASISQDSRVMYEAYNGLIAAGKFAPDEAFRRIQIRDIKRGNEFVKGQSKVIAGMAGDGGSLMTTKVRERMLAFGSLPDMDDATVIQMTRDSIAKDYITSNGRLLPRRYFPNEQAITHAQLFFKAQEAASGRIIEPDDVVVALPEGTSDVLFYDRKDPTRVRRLPVDRLVTERRAGAQRSRERDLAPSRNANTAVSQRLNPWRRLEGESGLARTQRINREVAVYRSEGVTLGTQQEWTRRFGTQPNQ